VDSEWEDRYQRGDVPWDTRAPSSELIRVLDEYGIPPGEALDIGCGTGTNTVYLAKRGFDATGLDLSPTAIAAAQKRSAAELVPCRFIAGDVLDDTLSLDGPYAFLFDRGCFHIVRDLNEGMVVN
jgi:SAM-dependent methyltransferase